MKATPRKPPAQSAPRVPQVPDSRGNVRVYIDLPSALVRKFNVLAAMRGLSKRGLLAQIVEQAVNDAKL